MKKRIVAFLMLLAVMTLVFASCGKEKYDFAGQTYIFEKLVDDGTVTISINEDGTYNCTGVSSHSFGGWEYADGVLTLTEVDDDETERINHFTINEGNLVFVNAGSQGFTFFFLEDGDQFIGLSK